ncbi:MAG: lytic transglycosylase domain-containing protein [Pseudomonadota bacterium]
MPQLNKCLIVQIWALAGLGFCLLGAVTGPARAAELDLVASTWSLCAQQAHQVEQDHGMPRHLLLAIAEVESGRWHSPSRENLAWPWTVMAKGKGRYLPSKAAAIAEVQALQAEGVTNIDVGCMQVNLHYHGDQFSSLEAAFDPVQNLRYAAGFLADLRADANSWTMAIGHYHSKTPKFGSKYRRKVLAQWRTIRHRENRQRREALELERQANLAME